MVGEGGGTFDRFYSFIIHLYFVLIFLALSLKNAETINKGKKSLASLPRYDPSSPTDWQTSLLMPSLKVLIQQLGHHDHQREREEEERERGKKRRTLNVATGLTRVRLS